MNTPFPPSWIEKTTEENRNVLQSFLSTLTKIDDFDPFDSNDETGFNQFIEEVSEIDRFYAPIGGISGYYQKVISLLNGEQEKERSVFFLRPCGI